MSHIHGLAVRAGGRLTFGVKKEDEFAISATFIAKFEDITITKTVVYDGEGLAVFEFEAPDTDVPGEYKWQVNENFNTGSPDKYPILDGGVFPILHIYNALDEV